MRASFQFFDKRDMLEVRTSADLAYKKIIPNLSGSAVAGVIVGLVITIFIYLLDLISEFAHSTVQNVASDLRFLPLYILAAVCLAVVMRLIIRVLPEAKGSGVPRTEAMLNSKKKVSWWRMSLATVIGSMVSFLGGLSVGSEGPSVQLGSGLAQGIEKFSGGECSRRYISNSGAAAGVSTAFGAPVTGILFVMEEVQRKFNPLMAASVCMAVIYATAINHLLAVPLGISANFFDVGGIATLPTSYLWIPVVVGVVCTAAAYLFNFVILKLNALSRKSRIPQLAVLIAVFVISAVVDVFLTDATGGGSMLINKLVNTGIDWQMTLILFVVKIVLICLCFRSGTTGGMMIPMLAIGALIGGLLGLGFVEIGLPAECYGTVVLISMCTFFGSGICAPLTVVALFVETTGNFSALLPLVLSVLIAQIVGRIIRQKPLYDTLAETERDKFFLPN